MSKIRMIAPKVPNVPWQEKPLSLKNAPIWRYTENPSVVKYRCENFLLTPEKWYEERDFVPNVEFQCATIHDSKSGKIAIYYGCADSYVGLAFTRLDEIVAYIQEHSVVNDTDTEIGRR